MTGFLYPRIVVQEMRNNRSENSCRLRRHYGIILGDEVIVEYIVKCLTETGVEYPDGGRRFDSFILNFRLASVFNYG